MTQPTIAEGATGPAVRWAQYRIVLTRQSLDYRQIDGIFGKVTKSAVEEFQSQNGLAVDGIVGPLTWAALDGDAPEPPTLANGSSGAVVQRLQTALNEGRGSFAPASNPVLSVDGIFGPHTTTAVQGMQQSNGIAADGIVGLQTWAVPVHAAGQLLADICGLPERS
jgi:peptidoglycan hydrolase-like protein with peptidoglycan-binding domain